MYWWFLFRGDWPQLRALREEIDERLAYPEFYPPETPPSTPASSLVHARFPNNISDHTHPPSSWGQESINGGMWGDDPASFILSWLSEKWRKQTYFWPVVATYWGGKLSCLRLVPDSHINHNIWRAIVSFGMQGIDPLTQATSVWGQRRGDCQQQGAGK